MADLPTKAQAEVLERMASGQMVDASQPSAAACIRRKWAKRHTTTDAEARASRYLSRTCATARIQPEGDAALARYRQQQENKHE